MYVLVELQAVDTIRVAIKVDGSGLSLLPPLGQLLGCPVRILPVDMGLYHRNTKSSAWCNRLTRSVGTCFFTQIRLPPDVLGAYDLTPILGHETSGGQARGVKMGKHLDGELSGQALNKVNTTGGAAAQNNLAFGSNHVQVVGVVSHGASAGDSNTDATLTVVLSGVHGQTLVS